MDSELSLFLSGAGHVFYALIIASFVILVVLFGSADPRWLALALAAIGGVFADLWAHGYSH
jgi:hypothetical protein